MPSATARLRFKGTHGRYQVNGALRISSSNVCRFMHTLWNGTTGMLQAVSMMDWPKSISCLTGHCKSDAADHDGSRLLCHCGSQNTC